MQTSGTVMQQVAPYLMLGTQLSVTVLVSGAVGWWLDSLANTSPWILIIGLVTGSIVGLVQFLRMVQRLGEKAKHEQVTGKE